MKKFLLLFVTFISGASIMIIEMLGSRMLAPYYGSSIYIWAILIGIVLLSLSVGYFVGGKYADKKPSYQSVVALLLWSALAVIILACIKDFLLLFTMKSPLPMYLQASIDAIFLFVPSTLLLAMISPLLAKLYMIDLEHSGSAIGHLYAFSAIGSIAGTFLGGIVLISYFGVTVILLGVGYMLALMAIVILCIKRLKFVTPVTIIILVSIIIGSCIAYNANELRNIYTRLIVDKETIYGRLWVFDTELASNLTGRFLTNTVHAYQSGMIKELPNTLLFPYTEYLDVFDIFNPQAKNILLIGGGAYSYPKFFIEKYTDKHLDVVDIDPAMYEFARTYFSFTDNAEVTSYIEDGRIFLRSATTNYDAIIVDAFLSSVTIPFHLTTKEFIDMMYKNLSEDGIVIVNIFSEKNDNGDSFLAAEYKTYAQTFPEVFVIKVQAKSDDKKQNFILIASKKKIDAKKEQLKALLTKHSSYLYPSISTQNAPVLTDNFAPIERYVR